MQQWQITTDPEVVKRDDQCQTGPSQTTVAPKWQHSCYARQAAAGRGLPARCGWATSDSAPPTYCSTSEGTDPALQAVESEHQSDGSNHQFDGTSSPVNGSTECLNHHETHEDRPSTVHKNPKMKTLGHVDLREKLLNRNQPPQTTQDEYQHLQCLLL